MKLLKQTHKGKRAVLTIALVSILTACGGGDNTINTDIDGGDTNDTTAPIVTAPENITVAATNEAGTAISDDAISAFLSAVTVTDNIDSNLVASNDAPSNIFPIATTTVTFSANDNAGNTSTAQATVTIVDQTPPVITLIGASEITVNLSENYDEEGATALDNVDNGVLTADVAGIVDINLEGIYTLTYSVTDAAGNAATPVTRQVIVGSGGNATVECATGESTADNKTHDCNYNPGNTAQGNFKLKYPSGEWISIGCSAGKPVADNSNTQWVRKERGIRIIDGDWLDCPEGNNYGAECICSPTEGENFHGISKDYQGELGNGLTHGIDYPGGGFVFNNSGHQTCLGIHKQGNAGEIESISSQPNGAHREESGLHHEECPLLCLGDACP